MIHIASAEFLTSARNLNESPIDDCMEVAFLGRSNVGKSSLINALTCRKQLAKSSSMPGKTQLINFFKITYENNDKEKFFLRFVDLPGFGYAKVSKTKKDDWQKNLSDFLEKRVSIRAFVHLVDSRHHELEIDKTVSTYLQSICRKDQEILTFYTKSDKLNQKETHQILSKKDAILVSCLKNTKIDKINELIFKTLFGSKNDSL